MFPVSNRVLEVYYVVFVVYFNSNAFPKITQINYFCLFVECGKYNTNASRFSKQIEYVET